MKLREKQGVILIFLNESFKKKWKKLQANHETRSLLYDHGWNIKLTPAHVTFYAYFASERQQAVVGRCSFFQMFFLSRCS